jgi:hypothetical protein
MEMTAIKVKLVFRTVGSNFGTVAIVKHGKDVLWESRTLPLGFFDAGRDLARAEAAKHNWLIFESK